MELSKSRISLYSQLSRRKIRDRERLFIAEGIKSVDDTADSFTPEAFIATEQWWNTPTALRDKLLDKHKEICFNVSSQVISKISTLSTPPEIIAVYRQPDRTSVVPMPNPSELYLILDGIQDPGNLGTIMRTAHWFGIARIYASEDTVDLYNSKTIQATMGSLGKVEIIYCDLSELVNQNPELPLYGTLLEGENIYKADLRQSGFIAMGNEGKGLSGVLRSKITTPLNIPPYHPTRHGESLNVAIATAIVLSQFRMRCR